MNLERNKILELLPLFVAGNLDPDQISLVEDGLRSFPDLSDDLEFCRNASTATARRVRYEALGHPKAEELVDYAEGLPSLAQDSLSRIADHLERCDDCRKEYEMIRASLSTALSTEVKQRESGSNVIDRLHDLSGPLGWLFKPRFALALGAIAVTAFVLLALPVDDESPLTLTLRYQDALRSAIEAKPEEFRLDDPNQSIDFRLLIPPSGLHEVRYDVRITTDDGLVRSDDSVTASAGTELDTLRIGPLILDPERRHGRMQVIVTEVLHDSIVSRGVVPETYYFTFRIVR